MLAGVAVLLVLPGCYLLEPDRPVVAQSEPPPQSPAVQQAAIPPLPRPAVRPAPVEPFDPRGLLGLDAEEVRFVLGLPDRTREANPATVWSYDSGACSLDLFFYMDLGSQKHRVLAYDVNAGKSNNERAIAGCAGQIRAQPRDGKK
jgi:hypothetical protein